jgi:hypothetical protein
MMNELLKDGLMILSGLIGGYLFIKIRQKVINQTKEVVEEKFNLPKFTSGMLNVTSPVGWAKDIASLFNLRKLIIIGVIIGVIFGYGYWRGLQGKPVSIDLGYGKEAQIKLDGSYLHIYKDGSVYVEDDKGNKIKQIQVKDIEGLKRKLRPYGFKLEPIVVAGGSIGQTGVGFEGGAGLSWFKYFKWNLDSFITMKGLYPLGASYQITDNSGIGLGAGLGFKGDKRVILYYKWKF